MFCHHFWSSCSGQIAVVKLQTRERQQARAPTVAPILLPYFGSFGCRPSGMKRCPLIGDITIVSFNPLRRRFVIDHEDLLI